MLWEPCHEKDGFCNCLKPFSAINVFIFELKKGKKTKSGIVVPKFSMFLLLLFS